MLNRRHLRVKVLQSLYAFIQSGNDDLAAGEKELLFGIEKIYDLYIYQFTLLAELHRQAGRVMEENRHKRLPTAEDLNPNTRFLDNKALLMIVSNQQLQEFASKRKIHWNNDLDLVRKLLMHIQQQSYFQKYLEIPQPTLEQDVEFLVRLVKKDLMNFELLHHFYEEKSIYWLDDWELVNKMLIKTLKNALEKGTAGIELLDLFKELEDRVFARDLFKRTILNQQDMDQVISDKTQNWDIERIALMDVIIMKMALTEILKFPEIPIKVSLNEYIELSKMYSTPKSKVFINGILDKLVEEFIRDNKINKNVKGMPGIDKS
ncbi:MAG: transcription antitermination factor NusB [Bacteroidales bacterium]